MGDITHRALTFVATRSQTGRIRPDTEKQERLTLLTFARLMGNRRLIQLGRSDIDRWLHSMVHLAPATRRTRWSVLRRFLNHEVDAGIIRRNPMNGIPAPKVPRSVHRALNAEQAAALFAACLDDRDQLILELGFQLGLRRAEIAALELGDVDLVAGLVSVAGKGGHRDLLPLTSATTAAVRAYLASNPTITAGPLVRSYHPRYRHRPVRPRWIGDQVRRIGFASGVKVANYDGVATHSLRHTMASDLYEATEDVEIVQDVLRHVSLATTSIYVRGRPTARVRVALEGRDYRGGQVIPVTFGRRASDRQDLAG